MLSGANSTVFGLKKLVQFFLIACLLTVANWAAANDETPANQLRTMYGENAIPREQFVSSRNTYRERLASRVQDDFYDFIAALKKSIGDRPSDLHEFLGFSGADYANKDAFKADFKQSILQIVKDRKARLGPKSVSIIVLGGTLDGFGVGYNLIEELKQSDQIQNDDVIVAGMVADQSVQYHVQGRQAKEPYDVISPKQSRLLVLKTYKDGENQTWELKTSKYDSSKTVSLLLHPHFSSRSTMHIMEGGEQALRESIEMLLDVRALEKTASNVSPEMRLYVGYREGKVAKMKGFKAATQMVKILNMYPSLKPKNLNVVLSLAGSVDKKLDPWMFEIVNPGYLTDPNFLLTQNEKNAIPDEEKQIRAAKFQIAMNKINEILASEINLATGRLHNENEKMDSWFNNFAHPIHDNDQAYDHYRKVWHANFQTMDELKAFDKQVKDCNVKLTRN